MQNIAVTPRSQNIAVTPRSQNIAVTPQSHNIAVTPQSPGGKPEETVLLRDVLNNKTGFPLSLDEFKNFLMKVEHCEENLNFYLAAQRYQEAYESVQLHGAPIPGYGGAEMLLAQLFAEHIRIESPEQINISNKMRTDLLDAYAMSSRLSPGVLGPAQDEVYNMMNCGAFQRWKELQTTQNLDCEGTRIRGALALLFGAIAIIVLSLMIGYNVSVLYRFLILPACFGISICAWQWHANFCVYLGKTDTWTSHDGRMMPIVENLVKQASKRMTIMLNRRATATSLVLLAFCFGPPNANGKWDV